MAGYKRKVWERDLNSYSRGRFFLEIKPYIWYDNLNPNLFLKLPSHADGFLGESGRTEMEILDKQKGRSCAMDPPIKRSDIFEKKRE